MARLELRIEGDNHQRFERAVEALGSEKQAWKAARRAVNKTGDKAFTRVKRAAARQVGLTQKKLVELGAIRRRRANFDNLSYEIRSSGKALSLKHFKAKQFSFGVRAKPWGRTQKFYGAFINVGTWRSGVPFDDGHVYRRGQRVAVCDKTFHLLQAEPYAGMFEPIEPRNPIPIEEAQPFDCRRNARRSPRETKGAGYSATTDTLGPCCGEEGSCC